MQCIPTQNFANVGRIRLRNYLEELELDGWEKRV
jgi:hypothetical protein